MSEGLHQKLSTGTPRATQAFVPKHLSAQWLARLDREVGELVAKTGGYFDLTLIFRGHETPITKVAYELRKSTTVD